MKNLFKYIKDNNQTLSSNEKLIRKYMLENFDEIFSTKTIGEKLYIAPSGVSRYLKKINYKNLKQLNKEKKLEKEGLEQTLHNIYLEKEKLLKKTYELNKLETIISFANTLSKFSTIYIYGVGHSQLEGRNLQMRLSRIGYNTILIKNKHDVITKTGPKFIEDSIFLFISHSGETKELIDIYDFLCMYEVQVLTITDNKNSTIANFSKAVLLVPKVYGGYKLEAVFSEVATSLLFDLIYMIMLNENYEVAYEKYKKTRNFLNIK